MLAGFPLCTLAVLMASGLGCLDLVTPDGAGYDRPLPPVVDRLAAKYEDLAARRFLVLADFEDAAQGTLFTTEPAGVGSVSVSTDRAVPDTGVGSLKMSLPGSAEFVVCRNRPGGQWGLPSDWTRHHLLIMSVYSPRKLDGFRVTLHSGGRRELAYGHPRQLLETGWNLIRVDLGEVGQAIDLSDVREIRLGCELLQTAVDLYLDNLILVDNEQEVFVTQERVPGDLYVLSRGQSLVVGAIDRFELVFARGRIDQWYDLASDPNRLHNLAGPGPLGPVPTGTPGSPAPPLSITGMEHWSSPGAVVETHQSLVSATPLQIIVQGRCVFASAGSHPEPMAASHEWVYTIYQDGRVYVQCSGDAGMPGGADEQISVGVACDRTLGFVRHIIHDSVDEDAVAGRRRVVCALLSRRDPGLSDLLVVPFNASRIEPYDEDSAARIGVTWRVPVINNRFAFALMLRCWPDDVDSPEQARPLAASYLYGPSIALDAGRLVRTDPGDLDNDGYSEARGYTVLQLDGNIARIRIDGREHLRFSPAFRIVDVSDRDVWVYLDGRLITDTRRDENGSLLFVIPGVVSREVLLEVTSRQRSAEPGP